MVKVREDLTGRVFGRLKVIEQAEDYVDRDGVHYARWLCECSCEKHNKVIRRDSALKSDRCPSCGCVKQEDTHKRFKKYNQYIFMEDYVIGISGNTDDLFYVDLDDYEKIKHIYWRVRIKHNMKILFGYNPENRKTVTMHGYLGFKYYDHIDRNELNNRKNNLRKATSMENSRNRSTYSSNKSGVTGVYWDKQTNKWMVQIKVNKKGITIGRFADKDDAIRARLEAEVKYFGEFAPQKYLYGQYGINNTK